MMFDRFVAALLVVSLTACSSVPPSSPGPYMSSPSSAAIDTTSRDTGSNPDKDTKSASGPSEFPRWIGVVFIVVLVVLGIAAYGVARDGVRIDLNK